LPHVKTGKENKYGIVAFHVHLTGNANRSENPPIVSNIAPTVPITTAIVKNAFMIQTSLIKIIFTRHLVVHGLLNL
jgi:hypothetical protein